MFCYLVSYYYYFFKGTCFVKVNARQINGSFTQMPLRSMAEI